MRKRKSLLKKLLLILAALAVGTAAAFFDINTIVQHEAAPYISDIDDIHTIEKVDCIIVLGARVYDDETLSPILKDRVDFGITLYEAGVSDKLLFTGDHGQDEYDEVNAMMDYAIASGVPEEDVFLDHAGFSTYESMVRAKEVFCVQSAVVVTQKFHLYRAVYLARRLGIDACGVNADPRRYQSETKNEIREALARVKDFLYINVLKPDPTYLGEQIPITGDSALTHDKQ